MKTLPMIFALTIFSFSSVKADEFCGTLEKIKADFNAKTANVKLSTKPYDFNDSDGHFFTQMQFLSGHVGKQVCLDTSTGTIELRN